MYFWQTKPIKSFLEIYEPFINEIKNSEPVEFLHNISYIPDCEKIKDESVVLTIAKDNLRQVVTYTI